MPVLALHDHDQTAFAFTASSEDDPVETPLRSRAGQEAAGGSCRFSAWRGRSGRRYVVSTFAIDDDAALTYAEAVILAVSADRRVLDVKDSGPWSVAERWRAGATRWWRSARRSCTCTSSRPPAASGCAPSAT